MEKICTDNKRTLRWHCLVQWLKGEKEYRPAILLLAAAVFFTIYLMPAPENLYNLLESQDPLQIGETDRTVLNSIRESLNQPELTLEEAARKAKTVVGIMAVAALLWGTVSIPIGATAFLLAIIMYATRIIPVPEVAQLYMRDAVFFIIGALAIAVGVTKTGLDKRIGLFTLGWAKNRYSLLFLFGPLAAVIAMFISAKILIAFLMPILMCIYKRSCRANGMERNSDLGLFLIFTLVYMTAMGGPGAPTVGARNVIIMDLFAELGKPLTFFQWMQYGFLFVPVGALATGVFLLLTLGRKIKLKISPGRHIQDEVAMIGRFRGKEMIMAGILACVVFLWIFGSHIFGLGGPAILGIVLMFVFNIVKWKDINSGVSWGIVWMYAAAVGMGSLILDSGAGLWLATMMFDALPAFFTEQEGLLVAVSILTSITTNLMNDGAAVAILGPITLPMSAMADLDIWKIGFAIAFSSSFAHCILIGRPGLVVAYALGRDPETGEHLLNLWRLFKYGCAMTLISWIILWGWVFYGYWRFLPFE